MNEKINITWAITVCNELKELTTLLNFLQLHVSEDDQILIQYDTQGVTPEVSEYLKLMNTIHKNHTVIGFPLNKDFASFKNNLKSHSNGSYIVQLDADEMLGEFFMENIHMVLERNPVDLVFVPRINTVVNLTVDDIQKWGWNVNEKGYVNYPDYQTRIYKNTDDITWMGNVHEKITGYNNFSNFPALDEWCIIHDKTIEKQREQNAFYETI